MTREDRGNWCGNKISRVEVGVNFALQDEEQVYAKKGNKGERIRYTVSHKQKKKMSSED